MTSGLNSLSFEYLLQKHKGLEDPLEVVGLEIADEAILLCLDEFMVCECDAHRHCFKICSG